MSSAHGPDVANSPYSRRLIGSEEFLSSPLVVLGNSLKSNSPGLIRHVLRNASQGLRSILVFFAQHSASVLTSRGACWCFSWSIGPTNRALAPSLRSTRMMVQSRLLAEGSVPRRHVCQEGSESFGDGEVSDDGITQLLVWQTSEYRSLDNSHDLASLGTNH